MLDITTQVVSLLPRERKCARETDGPILCNLATTLFKLNLRHLAASETFHYAGSQAVLPDLEGYAVRRNIETNKMIEG